jgi:hypothetical protein
MNRMTEMIIGSILWGNDWCLVTENCLSSGFRIPYWVVKGLGLKSIARNCSVLLIISTD